MAEWESSFGGLFLSNARLLPKEEIEKRYPKDDSLRAKLTRKAVEQGFDILYGENPNLSPDDILGYYDGWGLDVLTTAAYLYNIPPDYIEVGSFTDMSQPNAIYAAVKPMYRS